METLYALDFVSLLLSKETPRQAEISMSPHLKQTVPIGSLGLDITRLPQPSESEKREAELVSQGWKLEGLTSAADSLLRSATRLEREIEQETRYWEQVLAVKKEGWSICRLPRERHTLGVRYGFAEGEPLHVTSYGLYLPGPCAAAPEFRDRGLAAFRRGGDGNIVLDQGITASDPKILRVRIKDKGILVSSSSLPHASADTDVAIEELILRARNNIFEEELFHEITREARTLASQGVHSIGNVIHIPSSDDREVLLDIVPFSDETPQPRISTPGQDDLAELIALSLRILLSYAHRQNLRRRAQLPPPLTERKPPRLVHAIIRPILTYLQHQSALTALRGFLSNIVEPLRAAGLTCEFAVNPLSSLNLSTVTDTNVSSGKSTVDALIETLTRPLASSATITLPASTKLALEIRTHLYLPTFGTEYIVTNTTSSSHSNHSEPPSITFASKSDFQDHLLHLLTLDTVTTINTFPSLTDVDDAKSKSEPWLVTDAHSGELTKSFGGLGRSKRMVIAVDRDRLEVRWGWMNGKPEVGRYVWVRSMDGEEGGGKTLHEVVDEVGRYRSKKGESAG
jgi:mediator of RNA polymerase II transcription subunit 17